MRLELPIPSDLVFVSLAQAMDMIIAERIKDKNFIVPKFTVIMNKSNYIEYVQKLVDVADCLVEFNDTFLDDEWLLYCDGYEVHSEGA